MKKNGTPYIYKSLGLLIIWIFLTGVANAQQTQAAGNADSLAVAKISAETGLPKAKVAEALRLMHYRKADLASIATNKGLSRATQQSQLMGIFRQREAKLDSLLTVEGRLALKRQQEAVGIKLWALDSLVLRELDEQMSRGATSSTKTSGN